MWFALIKALLDKNGSPAWQKISSLGGLASNINSARKGVL